MKVYERTGASLRRAPYVWLALTLLILIAVLLPAARPLNDDPGSEPWTGWVALGLIIYSCGAGLFISSSRMASRTRDRMTSDRFALMQWSFGVTPALVGFAGTAGNGKGWPLAVGVIASAFLLILFARQLAHGPSD